MKGKPEWCHSVGRIIYRCARQAIIVNGVSIDPVAHLFRDNKQLAIGIETDLGRISARAANQRLSRTIQRC
jgi:hypothetical protein